MEHESMMQALTIQGINIKYVNIPRNLYQNTYTKVNMEAEGNHFPLEKGVKQGNPSFHTLFSCVLENIFRKL